MTRCTKRSEALLRPKFDLDWALERGLTSRYHGKQFSQNAFQQPQTTHYILLHIYQLVDVFFCPLVAKTFGLQLYISDQVTTLNHTQHSVDTVSSAGSVLP